MNQDRILDTVIQKIASGEKENILQALRQIQKHQLEGALDFVKKLLTHDDIIIRISAVKTYGESKLPYVVDELVQMLDTEGNQDVRATIALVLGNSEGKSVISVLANLLQDNNPRVRANAVEAISNFGDECNVPLIIPLLNDPNNRVKANAATALWKFGGLRMVHEMKDMLKGHEDKWSRSSAAYALGEMGGIHVVPALLDALNDPMPEVRRNVIKALGKIGDASIKYNLIPFLKDEDVLIRVCTVEALNRLNDQNVIPILLDMLEIETAPEVLEKIKHGILKHKEVVIQAKFTHILTALLRHPRDLTRKVAMEILSRI